MNDKEKEKDLLLYFSEKDPTIWDIKSIFDDDDDEATMKRLLPEPYFTIIKAIVLKAVSALDWHMEHNEAHEDIRKDIGKVEAKLRNHRHQLDKNYSAKAEF